MTDKQNAEEFLKFADSQAGWGLPPETTTGALAFLKSIIEGDVFAQMKNAAQLTVNMPEPEEVVEESDELSELSEGDQVENIVEGDEELDEDGDAELVENTTISGEDEETSS